jgi:hypothetical protein
MILVLSMFSWNLLELVSVFDGVGCRSRMDA